MTCKNAHQQKNVAKTCKNAHPAIKKNFANKFFMCRLPQKLLKIAVTCVPKSNV